MDDFLFSNDFFIIKPQGSVKKTIKVVRWLVLQRKFNFCTCYKFDMYKLKDFSTGPRLVERSLYKPA